jgi:hypothetical protein
MRLCSFGCCSGMSSSKLYRMYFHGDFPKLRGSGSSDGIATGYGLDGPGIESLLARMMRTCPTHIPDDWILRPHFNIWLSQKHRAILWLLVNIVIFRMEQHSNLTLQDYIDFLHRTRWKLMRNKNGRSLVGN